MSKLLERNEIKKEYTWDIESVYENIEQWEEDFKKLKNVSVRLGEYKGKLKDEKNLLKYFKENEEISRLFSKLFIYAHLKSDEDTTVTTYQSIKNKIDSFEATFKSINSFFIPEILSFSEDTVEKLLKDTPELLEYKVFLERVLKQKPHTLDQKGEKLLAEVSDCLNASLNSYIMLSNADMKFPNILNEEGEEVELSEVNYGTFIKSKDKKVRERAFKALFETYYNYKNTFASMLSSSIKNTVFEAKVRNYKSSLESSLKPNNIPVVVYDNLIETVNKNLKSLHRYVELKKKILKLDKINVYDLYVPLYESDFDHIEFDKAVEIVKEGLTPLGEEYLSILNKGLTNRWIDAFGNKGKKGGAYSWGSYDTKPFVLLNYNYQYSDLSTLAHELGHSIHTYYSNSTQSYMYAEYALFCAEVASITNECLLINYLINKETDKNRKLYLINQQLESIRTTFFRQTMFAEFEKITHEEIEKGNPLTAEDFCSIYYDLNKKYYGDNIEMDSEIQIEWARIPHFYDDFYVYQYATGFSAANSFAKKISNKEDKSTEKYINFLKSGSIKDPIDILKTAGVDMTNSEPIQDTIEVFNNLLDMLEAEI